MEKKKILEKPRYVYAVAAAHARSDPFQAYKEFTAGDESEIIGEVAEFIMEKTRCGIDPKTDSAFLQVWSISEAIPKKLVFEHVCCENSNLSAEMDWLASRLDSELRRLKDGREKKFYRLMAWRGVGMEPVKYVFKAYLPDEIAVETEKFVLEQTGKSHYHIALFELAHANDPWGEELFRYADEDKKCLYDELDDLLKKLDVALHPDKKAAALTQKKNRKLAEAAPGSSFVVDASFNWADETYIGGLTVMSPETFEKTWNAVEDLPPGKEFEFCFGTNEEEYFSKEDLQDMLLQAKEITPAEKLVLEKFIPRECFSVLFDEVLEEWLDGKEEENDEEDEEKEE